MRRKKLLSDGFVKILIVDDDKKALELLHQLLSKDGREISTAEDGLEAIKVLKEKDFDLIITDFKMPGATGIEVLKTARKVNPKVLVIIITGFATLNTALEAIEAGAYSYLTKPFKLDEIEILVNNAIENVQLIKENENLSTTLKDVHSELKTLKKTKKELEKKVQFVNEKMEKNQLGMNGQPSSLHLFPRNILPFHYTTPYREEKERILDEIKKLDTLREEGILAEEEFMACKRILLSKI
jgi:DNA-binding response OmpR family regulator